MKIVKSTLTKLILAVTSITAGFLVFYNPSIQAAEFTQRSVRIGTSTISATTSHSYQFTIQSNASVGSISFRYCSNSPLYTQPCSAPTGLNADNAVLTTQLGQLGFSIDAAATTANRVVLTRVAAIASPGAVQYVLSNIINPSTNQTTTFVRISTHSSVDGSGAPIDSGAVAFSTASSVGVGAYVPPFLTLCVGVTVELNCSSTTGSIVDFGLLVPNNAATATSQFAAATNDDTGYKAYMLGTTMTSGNNVIPGLVAPASSLPGTPQFGMNLRENNSPLVGANPSGVGTGIPVAGYNTANQFKFVPNDMIVSSTLPTNFNRFTVSYIVNVGEDQPPGVYSTTLTVLAVAQF